MDQGKILDIGNHEYLLAHSDKYKEIFSMFDTEMKVESKIKKLEEIN
jgi:hypothetical protein